MVQGTPAGKTTLGKLLAKALLEIEVKFQRFQKATMPKGLRSFITAYQPTHAIVITKDFIANIKENDCHIHFIPIIQLDVIFDRITDVINT